jgi:hypothetical protein
MLTRIVYPLRSRRPYSTKIIEHKIKKCQTEFDRIGKLIAIPSDTIVLKLMDLNLFFELKHDHNLTHSYYDIRYDIAREQAKIAHHVSDNPQGLKQKLMVCAKNLDEIDQNFLDLVVSADKPYFDWKRELEELNGEHLCVLKKFDFALKLLNKNTGVGEYADVINTLFDSKLHDLFQTIDIDRDYAQYMNDFDYGFAKQIQQTQNQINNLSLADYDKMTNAEFKPTVVQLKLCKREIDKFIKKIYRQYTQLI